MTKAHSRKHYKNDANEAWPSAVTSPSTRPAFNRVLRNRQLLSSTNWCYRQAPLLQAVCSVRSQKITHHFPSSDHQKGPLQPPPKHTLFNCRTHNTHPTPLNLISREIFVFSQAYTAYRENGEVCPFFATFLFKPNSQILLPLPF